MEMDNSGEFELAQEPYRDGESLVVAFENDPEKGGGTYTLRDLPPVAYAVKDIDLLSWENYTSASISIYQETPAGKRMLLGLESRGWCNFAGRRESYEDDPVETAVREFQEETKYCLPIPKFLRLLSTSRGHVAYIGYLEPLTEMDYLEKQRQLIKMLEEAPSDRTTEKTSYGWVWVKNLQDSLRMTKKGIPCPTIVETRQGYTVGDMMKLMADDLRVMPADYWT
jgi:8-oxo-dGTP pyrophosphatase MutT (NUDIX family)